MKIGIAGFGDRMRVLIGDALSLERGFTVTAVADRYPAVAHERIRQAGLDPDGIRFYETLDAMLEQEELDGVMIGTRCSLHAALAVKVLERGLPLFLEKPVATDMDGLQMLRDAYAFHGGRVVVSFPLRLTPMANLAREIIDAGQIGTVEHVQAVNNVPYGTVYYHDWYRDETETGGLFLQKATHDFDYVFSIVRKEPVEVCAMESKQIFRGDKPDIRCADCAEYYTCSESPYVFEHVRDEEVRGERCCYSAATGNHDSASAIVRFADGSHLNYSQNFFARKTAATRGARFLGYKGTLEFDWYTDELTVHQHLSSRTDTYHFDSEQKMHGGGDTYLMQNFMDVIAGRDESHSPLDAGLTSALTCLKARESARSKRFQPIVYDR